MALLKCERSAMDGSTEAGGSAPPQI